MIRLWHLKVLKHEQTVRTMTNLPGDSGSNQWVHCSCGERFIGWSHVSGK